MFVYGTGNSSLWNIQSVRRGAVTPVGAVGRSAGGATRTDKVTLSPAGKAAQMLEALTKQKQGVVEQRNKLIADTLESGRELKTIETQLEGYEEQLNTLDEMMVDITARQMEELAKEQEAKEPPKKQPATAEEADARQMQSMTRVASTMEDVKIQHRVSRRMEGEAKVKENQLRRDRLRLGIKEARAGDMAATRQYLSEKQDGISAPRALAKAAYQNTARALSKVHQDTRAYADANQAVADARREEEAQEAPPLDQVV